MHQQGPLLLQDSVQDGRMNGAHSKSVTAESSLWDMARQSVRDSHQRGAGLAPMYQILKPMLRGGETSGKIPEELERVTIARMSDDITEQTTGTAMMAPSSVDMTDMTVLWVWKRALHEILEADDHKQRRTELTVPPSLPVTTTATASPTPPETMTTETALPNPRVTTTAPPSIPVASSSAEAATIPSSVAATISTASPTLVASNSPVIPQVASTMGSDPLPTEMQSSEPNSTISTEPPLASGTGIMDRTNHPTDILAPGKTRVPSTASSSCNTHSCKSIGVLNDHPTLYVVLMFVIVSFCCCLRWKLCRKPHRDPRGEYRAVGRMLASNFDTELSDDEIHYTYDDDSGDESDAMGGGGSWSTARGKGSIELRNIGQDGKLSLEEMNG